MPINYHDETDFDEDVSFYEAEDFPEKSKDAGRNSLFVGLFKMLRHYWSLLLTLGVSALLFIGVYQFLGLSDLSQNLSSTHEIHRYQVGSRTFHVPMNYVRFYNPGQTSQVSQLELHARWPDFSGFSHDHVEAFSGTHEDKPVIRIQIYISHVALNGRQKLERIYALFFNSDIGSGPSGLLERQIKPGAPFEGEVFYYPHRYKPDNNEPFVARCSTPTISVDAMVCLRDIGLHGDMRITYSFPKTLLPEWQKLDPGVIELVNRFVQ